MARTVTVWGFETSNNIKVRIALGYKGIPYEFRAIDPSERQDVVRISGQHLTPVLVDDDRVLFDSAAIMRYLDANFPGTPRLFGRSRDEQWEIEDHELFARTRLAGPMMEVVHARVAGVPLDDATLARCAGDFEAAASTVADRLDGREWLVGETMTAADITGAAVVFRMRTAGMLELGPSIDRLAGWVDRVMRWDGESRRG